MTLPTPTERAEMRRVAEAATGGPWHVDYIEIGPTGSLDLKLYAFVMSEADQYIVVDEEPNAIDGEPLPDAAFIAMARTALPRLLDALDAMEARATKAEGDLAAELERSGKLVEAVAEEREACAAICEGEARKCAVKATQFSEDSENMARWDARDGILVKAAKIIRARLLALPAQDREEG